MTKLALKRAKDWRQRVQFLTDKILGLKSNEFVVDVFDEKLVQMTPTDFCFLVKGVGKSSWQRALEVYEWLNLCQCWVVSPVFPFVITESEAFCVSVVDAAVICDGNVLDFDYDVNVDEKDFILSQDFFCSSTPDYITPEAPRLPVDDKLKKYHKTSNLYSFHLPLSQTLLPPNFSRHRLLYPIPSPGNRCL
ncbi:hypothetical protein L6452_25475 [Arctium lappa]|uniref:Uncharacterized protein n=1 Tax=Arctium lappa TaxID=4217 RepID=A0ACB9ABK8_ARCLA|nr:hypothetical protein L6452_25475 [Arctium lappa]